MTFLLLLSALATIVLVLLILDFRIRQTIKWFSENYYETPDALYSVFARIEIARAYESFKRAEFDYKTLRDALLSIQEIHIEQEKIATCRLARGMYEFKKFRYRAKLEANISASNGHAIKKQNAIISRKLRDMTSTHLLK